MPKLSSNVFCGDLFLYKDSYTFYHASPSLELTQDTATYLPISSTPDRAQTSIRSLWPGVPAHRDGYTPITSTPRSLVAPSTSSLSMANIRMVFSPSPLPVSQVPSLVFPEISPPSQGSGSTPFERQFVGDFPREWNNINSQISPVARRNSDSSFSPTFSNASGTPSRIDYSLSSQDPTGRVSLIDKFISAAVNESAATENDIPFSTFSSQARSSPLSDLSDLTPLSSPEFSARFGRGSDLRSSSPPTSPTVERPNDPRESNIQHDDLLSNSGREPPPSRSTRGSSRAHDSNYQPAKGTTGHKRKRTSRSRDGDEIPNQCKKIRSAPELTSTDADSTLGTSARRRLPTNIPYDPQFSLFYLRFPVSSYLRLADGTFPLLSADSRHMAGIYNEPRDALDLYTPRFVKGRGATKVGVCPICIESPSRGGKGETVWLSMKFSAYKVVFSTDKNTKFATYPGPATICSMPTTIECPNPAKNERTRVQEGKCHKCKKWIRVESIKNIDIKVKELYWWKHAAACHQGTHMEGDDDFFLDDEIYRLAQQSSDRDP